MARDRVRKPPLKQRDPYKYYRNIHYGLYAGTWTTTFAPIVAVFGVKWNEYFDYVNNTGSSVKLTIGCVVAIFLAIIFAVKKARVEEKVNPVQEVETEKVEPVKEEPVQEKPVEKVVETAPVEETLKKATVEEKVRKEYSMIHYVAFIAIIWAFLFFFKAIIDDMFLITSVEFAGAVSAYGLSIADNKIKDKMKLYKEAQDELTKEEAKELYRGRRVDLL